jgi:Na+-driven multidrug efflux pump/anti-sigma regulatory factor (Ser/Thr protein kinase)
MKLLPIQILLVIIGGLNSIIDNAFAANLLGPDAMVATGLFSPVGNFLNAINVLLFGGAQVLCGRYLGKHMRDRTVSIFSLDMVAIILVSLMLTLVCEIIPGPISTALGASQEMNGNLVSYIRGFAIGLPFYCIGTQFTAFLQLEHQEKRSYIAVGSMFVLNAFFNWLFISVFKMGLFGLGLSTAVSNIAFCLIQALYYFSRKAILQFSMKSIRISDLPEVLLNGLPGAITQACIFFRGIILNHLIAQHVGEAGLSALSAINSFGCVYWAVPAGVTSAVIVLGSVYAGEEDREGLMKLMKTFLTRGVGLVTLVSLVLSACCVPLTRIFFQDPAAPVYSMTMMGFLLFPLSSPISAIAVGFSNYYHCMQREKIVRIVSVMDGIVGVILFALILIPALGMNGMWFSQILGCTATALSLYIYAAVNNRKLRCSFREIMCFPEGFGVPDEDRIDISVRSMDEVINISQKIWNFCESHGISEKQKYCASLCVEELAGNIVLHGFNDGKKHCIDIRVSCVKEDVMLSIKDDGIAFNPTEAAKLFDSDDKTHNIGLRIATGITKRMSYQNTFGLNILTMVV